MTGYIPTLEQIDELHRKIAPSKAAYELVHTHCVVCGDHRLPDRAPAERAVHAPLHITEGTRRYRPPQASPGGHVPPRLLDEHLVLIGGLLHDIGTYRVFKHDGSDGEPLKFSKKRYILHGLKGYEYLLDEGVDESIAQFCRNHTGVGLTRDDVVRQELPLPPADYVPMNLEQEVVMYADKFHSKSVPPKFLQVEAYTARAERFGGENKQRWLDLVAKYGVPDIPALAEKYGMRMI